MKKIRYVIVLLLGMSSVIMVYSQEEHKYVDLGLPSGTLWATCNIGANSPEDYGDYIAWGETKSKDDYSPKTYKFFTDLSFDEDGYFDCKISKYNCDEDFGEPDDITILDNEDDAAHIRWGGKWRMPTARQWEELKEKCSWKWTDLDDKHGGYKVIGPNGKSIFLPAAGFRGNSSLHDEGCGGNYWSRTLGSNSPICAWNLNFISSIVKWDGIYRCLGFSVRPVCLSESHKYVDLGLPSGTLWATCNIGASTPEEYGDYFAWGETEPKGVYDEKTYKYFTDLTLDEDGDVDDYKISKYNRDELYDRVDDKTILDYEDDAAHVNWGDKWCMPTKEQWDELKKECSWKWMDLDDEHGGYKVIGSNGKSIFLPAAGCRIDSSLSVAGSNGSYWSRTLSSDYPSYAWFLDLCSSDVGTYDYCRRYYGQSVRPVRFTE
ncbi:MAG: hypothetical protein IK000_08390 [Bacteroidaceae bacterium]|nr:hypothetical protein [Bacteroidaceae bacterium]